jgi:hypothetical protein
MAFGVQRTASVKPLAVIVVVALTLLPVPLAAEPSAGAVRVALATATVAAPTRVGEPIGVTDRVKTGDGMFARLLLGGRVMVLARAGAALSITEVPGAATIEVESGRIAVTVDRDNLHPEDLIEVRPPHAVVTVPTENLIVDVAAEASTFTALGARVEIFPLDPVSGAAVEPPMAVASEQVMTVTPLVPATDVAAATGVARASR